jgi:hypothetical protein
MPFPRERLEFTLQGLDVKASLLEGESAPGRLVNWKLEDVGR